MTKDKQDPGDKKKEKIVVEQVKKSEHSKDRQEPDWAKIFSGVGPCC